jgi:hypothetical protein
MGNEQRERAEKRKRWQGERRVGSRVVRNALNQGKREEEHWSRLWTFIRPSKNEGERGRRGRDCTVTG